MTDRRAFLRALGSAGLGAAVWPALGAGCGAEARDGGHARGAATRVGPAAALGPLGLQLYTVRRQMARDFEGTLAQVAEIGYQQVEFTSYFQHGPQEVRQALARAGLVAPSVHVPIQLARENWPRALEVGATIGHSWLVVPSIPGAERTPEGYRAVAELFNQAGEAAREVGLRFAYHNHEFEFDPAVGLPGDVLPLDFLLQATDPELVEFELDFYWTVRGGGAPLDYFERFPGRFSLSHVKDSAGPPEHRMVDPGAGVIDFPAILAARERAGMRHFFVEHDAPENPFATARAGYEYLAALDV